MKLKTVQVENFKSIEDSTEFSVQQLTSLVGKNESGKTAILQALYRMRPDIPEAGRFEKTDYPRRKWRDWGDEGSKDNVVTATWELSEEELDHLRGLAGPEAFPKSAVTSTKGYENKVSWDMVLNHGKAVKSLLESSELSKEERDAVPSGTNVQELIEYLKGLTERSNAQAELLATLQERFPSGSFTGTVTAYLGRRMPHFVYFADYYRLPGRVSVTALTKRNNEDQLTIEDRMFEALLRLVGGSIEDISSEEQSEHLIAEIEGLNASLSDEIFEYWTQNRHLKVDCKYLPGLAGDEPPFNTGFVFQTRIFNERHRSTVNFDDRSTGFIWFFSFLVWFSQAKRHYGENLIILLDEPGLSLHATAQSDLLRYMKERLLPSHQVIYSTHSPFMIDAEDLLSARTVEDVEEDGKVLGTKVRGDVLSTDSDTIFPLRGALGYEITQTLFVGAHSLLVEGPSDLLYLQWASRELTALGREGLDPRWTITPCGGVTKIGSFLALFSGARLNIAVLTDHGQGDKAEVQRLRDSILLKSGRVFSADMYAGEKTADIEDMLGRELYTTLVNRAYGLKAKKALPKKAPDDAPTQVLKEVEQHFKVVATDVDEFDHFRPSRYLLENASDLRNDLPALDEAFDRFEGFFRDVNPLIDAEARP